MTRGAALAVDLGGTFLRSALVLHDGRLGRRTCLRLRTVFDGDTPEAVWEAIVARIGVISDEARPDLSSDAPLIIAFPGPIAAPSSLLSAPTLTGAAPIPTDLTARIAASSQRPIRLLNDVAAAAFYVARSTGTRRFMLITVSSGIGSRVIISGVDSREPQYSGEIGHLVVDRRADALECDCGGRGHLGSIASGRAVERAARKGASASPRSFAASACSSLFGATPETLNNEEHLVPAILANDAWATGFLEHAIGALAPVVLNAVVAVGLERVYVIGGFATALGQRYATHLNSALQALNDSAIAATPADIVQVLRLRNEACLLGAACLI